jgi:hypothetical protein
VNGIDIVGAVTGSKTFENVTENLFGQKNDNLIEQSDFFRHHLNFLDVQRGKLETPMFQCF